MLKYLLPENRVLKPWWNNKVQMFLLVNARLDKSDLGGHNSARTPIPADRLRRHRRLHPAPTQVGVRAMRVIGIVRRLAGIFRNLHQS